MWKIEGRPGPFGEKREDKFRQYNKKYGEGNWRIMWTWGVTEIPSEFVYLVYEDAYYRDSFNRENIWEELLRTAKNVWDNDISNIESGLDYKIQEAEAIHLQDIAIRRVALRRGWKFKGKELVQIRSKIGYFGDLLSPGKVNFHMPELIYEPHLSGWWDLNSIEDFYQSNKVLQVKE